MDLLKNKFTGLPLSLIPYEVVFAAQHGSEMRNIFTEAIRKYVINENRILRYADRRKKKETFKEYWNSIQKESETN